MAPLDDKTAGEKIADALRAAGEPLSYGAIVKAAGIHNAQAARVLDRLAINNVVFRTNGRYALVTSARGTTAPLTPPADGVGAPKAQTEPICRFCGRPLIVPETWGPSYKRSGDRICITCAKNKDAKGAPAREHLTHRRVAAPLHSHTPQPPAPAAIVPVATITDGIRAWLETVRAQRIRATLIEHHLVELQALIKTDGRVE